VRGDASLPQIARVLLYSGATTFGGMWAATRKLEKDLVDRTGWLSREELRTSFLLATLIPSPKFLGLGGLLGFRMGGWLGSLVGTTALILPPSLMVLAAAALISPSLLDGPLAPLNRSISIAVVGLLFANAYMQMRGSKVNRRKQVAGVTLSAALFLSIVAGVPLIAVAFGGFILGAALIRPETEVADAERGRAN